MRECVLAVVVFCKQKTAYEMRISDWSSDVCSSDLHVGRAHGLVGADEHKVAHAVFCGRLGGAQRTQNVVLDAGGRVVLYQRHVLVGGGVVHRVRVPGGHDLAHTVVVLHRGQQGHQHRWRGTVQQIGSAHV